MTQWISDCKITPVSLVKRDGTQMIGITCTAGKPFHGVLTARDRATGEVLGTGKIAFAPGENKQRAMLPAAKETRRVKWDLVSDSGEVIPAGEGEWKKPREWTLWFMISSHTDIGLHNSQYFQRRQTERFLDEAMALCDETADRPEENRYRYVIEGTWVFDNYPMDRGEQATRRLVEEYIKPGRIGLCTGIAGNHTQVFGPEEINRYAYERKRMKDAWGIDCRTMSMMDNNGMSWGIVQPLAEAGYENIIFSPNPWNPYFSAVWKTDTFIDGFTHNSEAGGGGSRMDMRFVSALPRVFWWLSKDGKHRLLVFSGGKYSWGGTAFGLSCYSTPSVPTLLRMEDAMADTLATLEEKVPYDLWLAPCYCDDQEPGPGLTDTFAAWNGEWLWPRLRTCGDPDEPLNLLKKKFGDRISSLRGEMTGGWYQHPLSAPDLLSRKMEAERALTEAEKLSCVCAVKLNAPYPAEKLNRAWHGLMLNDEHSYGVSGYQGRSVYETWIQHRDWIDTALETGRTVRDLALKSLAAAAGTKEDSLLLVNTASAAREEWAEDAESGGICRVTLPAFGAVSVPLKDFRKPETKERIVSGPPSIGNRWYDLTFDDHGGIRSIYDKALARELLEEGRSANQLLYTRDNHRTFVSPGRAEYRVLEDLRGTTVIARMHDGPTGAVIEQRVTLPSDEKRIDIENRLFHVRAMFNFRRYDRYLYQAFPFRVEGARRYCHLNGCVAEYGTDLTGHSTPI